MGPAASAIYAQQQALGHLQVGMAMTKNAAKAEQQTATILANAIEATSSGNGTRGTQLDITV